MIDRGHDIVDRALDWAIDFYYDMKKDITEVFRAGYENSIIKVAVWIVIGMLVWEIGYMILDTRTVTVVTDTSVGTMTQTFETRERYVGDFLTKNDIDYTADLDIISSRPLDKIKDGMTINITKAITVSVVHDGIEDTITFQADKCYMALNELGLTLGEYDTIEPALEDEIYDGSRIVIKRITIDYIVEEADKSYKTVYKADPKMTIGKTKVTQKGTTGVKEKTYLVVLEDGVEIARDLIKEEVLSEKQDKVISYGTKILKGVPAGLTYVKKYTHVRAVSYWFSGNPHGAYGLKCEYGTCAVDKNLIPLGSLLYVEGYGYAIANDVGSGVKGKTIDLYMEKLSQCGIWGARWTTVYVIRSGPER